MNVLVVCGNSMQILSALRLRRTVYKEDRFVIVIIDTIVNVDLVKERIEAIGIVDEVVIFRNNCLTDLNTKKLKIQSCFSLIDFCKGKGELSNYQFDILLAGNIYGVAELYYNRIHNRRLEFYLLMDGIYNYTYDVIKETANRNKEEKFKHPILKHLRGQYIFGAEYGYQDSFFQSYGIPALKEINNSDLRELNEIFDYKPGNPLYDRPVIFFQQAFESDGIAMNEIEFADIFAEYFGKDQMLIKRHPRSVDNSFKEKGYDMSESGQVPWELMMLNCDMEKKIFVSVASTATIMPNLVMESQNHAFLLFKLRKDIFKSLGGNYQKFCDTIEKIVQKLPYFYFPESMQEFRESVGRIYKEWEDTKV